jgi:exo-1,4-beta-D-glucosaminidase
MRQAVIDLDGTRPFISSSSGWAKMPENWLGSYPDNKPTGVYSGGPYAWKDPKYYYRLADTAKDWVFKDETGIPSLPPLNTLRKIIPNHSWDTTLPFPFNNSWGYHDACTGAAMYDKYNDEMIARYGKPMNMDSFVNKMQLMNATGYQGIFEAANSKIDATGGVMLWKLNAAFPSVVWQIYDWYLNPNAGYYFIQNACEPLHVQFNQNDSSIAVINRTRFTANNLTATAQIFSIDGKKIFEKSGSVTSIDYDHSAIAFSMKEVLQQHPELNFIILSLKNDKGKEISKNVYWTAKGNDYTALNKMAQATLQAEIIGSSVEKNERVLQIKVKNTGSQIAFFTRLQAMQKEEEIMPSFWSDNYFTLVPNAEETLTVRVPVAACKSVEPLRVNISGWNVKAAEVKVRE